MTDRPSSEIFLYEQRRRCTRDRDLEELFGISERFGTEIVRRGIVLRGSHLANNMDSLAKYGQVGQSVSKSDVDAGRSERWEPMTMSAPLSPGCGG